MSGRGAAARPSGVRAAPGHTCPSVAVSAEAPLASESVASRRDEAARVGGCTAPGAGLKSDAHPAAPGRTDGARALRSAPSPQHVGGNTRLIMPRMFRLQTLVCVFLYMPSLHTAGL